MSIRAITKKPLTPMSACSTCGAQCYVTITTALARGWSLTVCVSTNRMMLRCPRCDAGEMTRGSDV
jgi:hypothetical protein